MTPPTSFKIFFLVWLLCSNEALVRAKSIEILGSGSSASSSSTQDVVRVNGVCEPKKKWNDILRIGGGGSGTQKSCEESCQEGCLKACGTCTDISYRQNTASTSSHSHTHALDVRGGSTETQGALSLDMIKILLQLCLTTVNVACWLIPLKMKKFTESKLAISVANAFSGGVFLSLAFGHLLPDSAEAFVGMSVPESTPYFLCLTGYMMIFFVEKIAFDAHALVHSHDHDHGDDCESHKHHHHSHDNHVAPNSAPAVVPAGSVAVAAAPPAGGGAGGGAPNAATSGRSAMILLLALSVHSLFETMAMGLCDTALEAGLLGLSIGLHQPAESIALLVSFLKSGLPQKEIIKMLSVFSLVGPLGLLIGLGVNEFAGKIVDAILVAITSGTFIYVGATEVIAEEFETPTHKWKKFAALMTGIISIAFITNATHDFHHHDHDH